jgi:hypothetical protein
MKVWLLILFTEGKQKDKGIYMQGLCQNPLYTYT